jgi:hypothetical protein
MLLMLFQFNVLKMLVLTRIQEVGGEDKSKEITHRVPLMRKKAGHVFCALFRY